MSLSSSGASTSALRPKRATGSHQRYFALLKQQGKTAQLHALATAGGQQAQATKRGHRWTPEQARAAQAKGLETRRRKADERARQSVAGAHSAA